MIIAPPPFPSIGVDCVTILNAQRCQALKAAGIGWVMRYTDTLTVVELETIHGEGMGAGFVSYAPEGGWEPSSTLGTTGAMGAVAALRALGVPSGVTLFADLEGVSPTAPADDVMAWGDSRASMVKGSGYDPGVYVGAGAGLNAAQLYSLGFDKYWRSLSDVPTPACGYVLTQAYKTTIIGGTEVDVDYPQYDWRGRMALLSWGSQKDVATLPGLP